MKKALPPQPVALITGSAGGLGAFLARTLAQMGYAIVLHRRSGASATLRLARQLRQHGTPTEVAAALHYLLSPEAAQVTGTNLVISGGWNL